MKKKPLPFKVKTISLTAARQHLFELVEGVEKSDQPLTLTEHGEPKVVMLSINHFERWAEIMAARQESVAAGSRKLIAKSVSRYERLAESLEAAGFLLREKPNKGYGTKLRILKKN